MLKCFIVGVLPQWENYCDMGKCDICAFTVAFELVTSVQERHMGGHTSGFHPTVNYLQLHYNVTSLAICMQLCIMRYYKYVQTLLGLNQTVMCMRIFLDYFVVCWNQNNCDRSDAKVIICKGNVNKILLCPMFCSLLA